MPRRPRPPLPLDRWLRRRRWRTAATLLIVLLAIVALIWGDRSGWLGLRGDDLTRYDGRTFAVTRVIDGDTLDIDATDGERATTRVRLWGIQAPEPAHFGDPKQPLSDEATALARELAGGRRVTLELEPGRVRGSYGRLLAHVELPDGSLLSARMLEAGLAYADGRWPHDRLGDFELLEQAARKRRIGLWSLPPRERPPPPRGHREASRE